MEKEELEFQEVEKEERNIFWTIGKAILALMLVWGLVYFSGIRQYFFFRETPSDIEVPQMERVLDVEQKTILVDVFLVREEILGSDREEASIRSMINNSSSILSQAGIDLEIDKIMNLDLERGEVSELIGGGFYLIDLSEERINIILVKTLGELNGLAYPNQNVAIMPDYLAGRDYRTLTHEVGHILGLGHKDDQRYVMNQGSYGLLFSKEEVKIIRDRLDEKF